MTSQILLRIAALFFVFSGFFALIFYMMDATDAGLYRESAKKLKGKVVYRTLLASDTTQFVVKAQITKDDVYIKKGKVIELTPLPLTLLPQYNIGAEINVGYDPINPLFFFAYDTLPSSRKRLSTYWWVFILLGFATWSFQLFNFNQKK